MRRALSLLTVCMLFLTPLSALCEAENRFTVEGLFSVAIEEGYIADDKSYIDESTPNEQWLLMVYNSDIAIDITLSPAKGYEGASLSDMSDTARYEYLVDRLNEYALNDVDSEGIVISDRDGTPFYLFSLADLDGAYLLGETLANGSHLRFTCYRTDFSEPTIETLDALKRILKSYEVVK